MKTLFIALNSKYIHTALAPWYLKASCGAGCGDTMVREFTINDSSDAVLTRIYKERPDVAAFSCYIWNIEFILKLAQNLKKLLPDLIIVLGGPEVSFDAAKVLEHNEFINFVLSGEGEIPVSLLLQYINGNVQKLSLQDIPGLAYKNEAGVINSNMPAAVEDLDDIVSPYTDEMLASIGNRIVYFESSRGCPFSCSYCLSSISKGVRFMSMDRIRRDITRLAKTGVKQIKFVDRTFNCNKERAAEIFHFIIENFTSSDGKAMLNFHFEAAADLFDDKLIEVLATAPCGLIQLEIGVQTVNPRSLEAIKRKTDLEVLFKNFNMLRKANNIHLHLDLIAGLPFEDYSSFITSFNRVYAAGPHQLQLGFLKLLKGSELRERKDEFGYIFREYPPYEVLSNNFINYDSMAELKGIEDLVDRYFNSGKFTNSLAFLINNHFENAYNFFKSLYDYYDENRLLYASQAMKELYSVLFSFSVKHLNKEGSLKIFEFLRLDYLAADSSGNLPQVLRKEPEQGFREKCFDFLKSEKNIEKYLPQYIGTQVKNIIKHVHFEPFSFDVQATDVKGNTAVILFDYSSRDIITGLYRYVRIEM